MTAAPILSIVTTFRNEELVLEELLSRLKAVLGKLEKSYEIILVNDASTDGSLEVLKKSAASDASIKIINMSARFGVPACLMAGLEHASGEAVITLDADLQDPPEIIPELVKKWQEGNDVVYTVRTRRSGEPELKKFLTQSAYKILRAASTEVDLPVEAGDFRLLSRRALGELLRFKEKSPYLRGLVRLIGFQQAEVPYERAPRFKGESHFPILTAGPVMTFLSGLFSMTAAPLLIIKSFAVLFLFLILITGLGADLPSSLIFLFFSTALFVSLSVLGFYLYRIHLESLRRPAYIVESKINFSE